MTARILRNVGPTDRMELPLSEAKQLDQERRPTVIHDPGLQWLLLADTPTRTPWRGQTLAYTLQPSRHSSRPGF
jgi:hypothetical protein